MCSSVLVGIRREDNDAPEVGTPERIGNDQEAVWSLFAGLGEVRVAPMKAKWPWAQGSRLARAFWLGVCAALMLCLLPGVMVQANGSTIYVDVDAPVTGARDGSSWDDAYTDLQVALDAASSGDQIWVAAGIYTPTEPAGRAATFQLLDGVDLYGGYPNGGDGQRDWENNTTILSGDLDENDTEEWASRNDNSYHVVTGCDNAVLDGFTVTGGNASGEIFSAPAKIVDATAVLDSFIDYSTQVGGGMFNSDPSSRRMVTDSTSSESGDSWNLFGGGMLNLGSSPTVTNCTFEYNTAYNGGGGMYNYESSPTVTNCTFKYDTAFGGGGMANEDGSDPKVTDCTFKYNTAFGGGGMANYKSNPEVTDCTFGSITSASSGNEAYYGGGMDNEESSPSVTDCTFAYNTAFVGGGMNNYVSCSPEVTNCTFSNNVAFYEDGATASYGSRMYNETGSDPKATDRSFSDDVAFYEEEEDYIGCGGGMANEYGSDPKVTDCTFEYNTADAYGGGMENYDSCSPTVTNCTFEYNTADAYGGGMENWVDCSLTVTNCTFSGNSADYGGGMDNYEDSSPTVTNCTFSGNSADYGGGMYNYDYSSPKVTNCTFSGNSGDFGGGMYNEDGSDPKVKNTILANGTSGDDCYCDDDASITSEGYNLVSDHSGDTWFTQPSDLTATNPLLDPNLRDNGGPTLTHALLSGSPAIDAIPSPYNGAPSEDQRGFPRPYGLGGFADIGAVEMQLAYSLGDVNGDGAIDLLDVVLCAQIARGLVAGTPQQRAAADVDDDGDVDMDDVTMLSDYILAIGGGAP